MSRCHSSAALPTNNDLVYQRDRPCRGARFRVAGCCGALLRTHRHAGPSALPSNTSASFLPLRARRWAAPNPSVNRSANGMPPWPRGATSFNMHRAARAAYRCRPVTSNVRRCVQAHVGNSTMSFRVAVPAPPSARMTISSANASGSCRGTRFRVRQSLWRPPTHAPPRWSVGSSQQHQRQFVTAPGKALGCA